MWPIVGIATATLVLAFVIVVQWHHPRAARAILVLLVPVVAFIGFWTAVGLGWALVIAR